MFKVEIIEVINGSKIIIKSIPCLTIRNAEKVQAGIEINLNHERFYTRIVT